MVHKLLYIPEDKLLKKLFMPLFNAENNIQFMGAQTEWLKIDRQIRLYSPSIILVDTPQELIKEKLLLCVKIRERSLDVNTVLLVDDLIHFPSILAHRAGVTMVLDRKMTAASIFDALNKLTIHTVVGLKVVTNVLKNHICALKGPKNVSWKAKMTYYIDLFAPNGYQDTVSKKAAGDFLRRANRIKSSFFIKYDKEYLKKEGFVPKNDKDLTFLHYHNTNCWGQ